MKCCECVYKKTFSICGNDNSPFFNKEVGATQSCEFFKENPAQIHFSNGMKNSLSNNLEEAVKEFEAYKALAKQDTAAYFLLGRAYVHAGDLEKAAAAFAETQDYSRPRSGASTLD